MATPIDTRPANRKWTPWRPIPVEIICYALAAAAVVACFLLYGKTESLGAAGDREDPATALLQEVKRRETAWSDAVLIASFGYTETYDAANAALRQLLGATQTLRGLVGAGDESAEGMDRRGADLLQAYSDALRRKRVFAEHMMSAHAVIGNSAAYLPTLERALERGSDDTPAGGGRNAMAAARAVPAASPPSSAVRTRELAVDLAAYIASPSARQAQSLRDAIAQARTSAANSPSTQDDAIFVEHAAVVLRSTESLDASVKAFAAVPSASVLDALIAYAAQRHAAAARSVQTLSMGILLLGLLGCWLLATAVGQSLRRYRSIRATNAELRLSKEAAEMQLIQAAKMSAIGQLVAGVVHEINTPLAYVKATFEVLRDQMLMDPSFLSAAASVAAARGGTPPPGHDGAVAHGAIPDGDGANAAASPEAQARLAYFEEIETLFADGAHGIAEISALVLSLKNFSRIDHAKISVFSVEDGLRSALVIAKHEIKYVADVETDFQHTPQITGAPSHINQVFLNIIMNACQAMAGSGKKGVLRIATRHTEADEVQVVIGDTGQGIPPDVLPRIFDPYFTTKPVDSGTGTGLAICDRIIRHHRGRIDVRSEVGVGTTFTVYLPIGPAGDDAPVP